LIVCLFVCFSFVVVVCFLRLFAAVVSLNLCRNKNMTGFAPRGKHFQFVPI